MTREPQFQGEALEILLVEDDPDHAELVTRNLDDKLVANRITHVWDGEAALDYVFRRGEYAEEEKSPRPHLILLDLRLPRIDGLEVLTEIKADQVLRRIPVVVLTSSEAEIDIARAYDNHANSYLVKPVDFAKFRQLMRDFGFYWLAWNRHPRRWRHSRQPDILPQYPTHLGDGDERTSDSHPAG